MPTIKGRAVKVEVALTFAAAVNPSAVTKAYPPVATLTGHGIADGTVGFWTVPAGMVELDQQAVLVDNAATNTFELPGLDSSNYSTYTAGSFTAAATWGTISESASYAIGGGAATTLDDTRLMDSKQRNVSGLLAPQDVTVDVRNQVTSGTAMAFVERAAMNATPCLFRITQGSTVLRVFYGTPSLPGESVSAGQLATGQFAVTIEGFAVKPNV